MASLFLVVQAPTLLQRWGSGGFALVIAILLLIFLVADSLVLEAAIRWITGARPGVAQVFVTSLTGFAALAVMLAGLALYCHFYEASAGSEGVTLQSLRLAGATLNPLNPEGLLLLALFYAVMCLIVATRHSMSFGRGVLIYLTSRVLALMLGGGCCLCAWLGAKLAE